MKTLTTLMILIIMGTHVWADTQVTVPWEEVKSLYRERIERELGPKASPTDGAYSITEARYDFTIASGYAKGTIRIAGEQIFCPARPIPLLGGGVAITGIESVTGGNLLSGDDKKPATSFLPGGTGPFRINLSVICPLTMDNRFYRLSMDIPRALKNTLVLDKDAAARLMGSGDMTELDGKLHFSARHHLDLRFTKDRSDTPDLAPEIALYSVIRLLEKKVLIATAFLPRKMPDGAVIVTPPKGFALSHTHGYSGDIKQAPDHRLRLDPVLWERPPIELVFMGPRKTGVTSFEIPLPNIMNNQSRESYFHIAAAAEGEIVFPDDLRVKRLPRDDLSPDIAARGGRDAWALKLTAGNTVRFHITRWRRVPVAPVTLDAITFLSTFEENGRNLSILRLAIPPHAGDNIRIGAVPDARVWSLKVNGEIRQVYTDDGGDWLIPLPPGKEALVALAMVNEGRKLGLSGRLETVLPRTGLQARQLRVGLALPERIKLVSLEGDISPDTAGIKQLPPEFMGEAYFFSRAFYGGETMDLAFYYKEPVKGTPE